MQTSVHPYKGYLNTRFRIYVKGDEPIEYNVYTDGTKTKSIKQGVATPNVPCDILFQQAGMFTISFANGDNHTIYVVDGYRYGGNKLKKAFVFDDCPWAFVVMHDRTYFYNRDTKQSFVEPISPDEIEEVSSEYVLFRSKNQREITLFSLEKQQPILWIDNVLFITSEALSWEESNDETADTSHKTICLYSLTEQATKEKIVCEGFSYDAKKKYFFYSKENSIYVIDLTTFNANVVYEFETWKRFVTFVGTHYAVFEQHRSNNSSIVHILNLYDTNDCRQLQVSGQLARVNDKSLINIDERCQLFRNFDFNTFEPNEATIECKYIEIDLYPLDWEIKGKENQIRTLYTEKITRVSSQKGVSYANFAKKLSCVMKCLETDYEQVVKQTSGETIITERFFLFYNRGESLIIPRYYPNNIQYIQDKKVECTDAEIILKSDHSIQRLSCNGFWDSFLEGNYDLSKFKEYHILQNEDDKSFITLSRLHLGNLKKSMPFECIFDNFVVYQGGICVSAQNVPDYISPKGTYGLSVSKDEVILSHIIGHHVKSNETILQDLYDTSSYSNVLLSEDGKHVIFRKQEQTMMLDLEKGKSIDFDNLLYIQHINGIRPQVRISSPSQAILINPMDGQPVNSKLLREYQFVSPDYKLYADKEIDKYVEYYNVITKSIISKDDYIKLANKYEYSLITSNSKITTTNRMLARTLIEREKAPLDFVRNPKTGRLFFVCGSKKGYVSPGVADIVKTCTLDDLQYAEVSIEGKKPVPCLMLVGKSRKKDEKGDEQTKKHRLELINNNFEYFFDRLKKKFTWVTDSTPKEEVLKLLSEPNLYKGDFRDLFIEKRGVAVIRRISNGSEYARIALGPRLWFLNYVSFSHNSRYVAIAGRYPNESIYSGLFMVYDLNENKAVIDNRDSYAVWTTAFTKDDIVAAYTSNPNTFVGSIPHELVKNNIDERQNGVDFNVRGYNFLSFSPDGRYFACSQQGYLPYNNQNGTTRFDWGHQPSTIVSLRSSDSPNKELIVFHDLAEVGNFDPNRPSTIASVSFSNDNKSLMMVGIDGVVVVRNLHIDDTPSQTDIVVRQYSDHTTDDYGTHYGEFVGSYAQDVMGYSDDVINDAFEGDPDAYWNID